MVSIGFYHKQFLFFFGIFGILAGLGYLVEEQTGEAAGRPLQIPPGRNQVVLDVLDQGRVRIEGTEVAGVVQFGRKRDAFSYLLLEQLGSVIPELTIRLNWPRPVKAAEANARAIIIHNPTTTWRVTWEDPTTLVYTLTELEPAASVSLLVELPKGVVLPSPAQRLFGTIRTLPQTVWLTFGLVLPLATVVILLIVLAQTIRLRRGSETDRILPTPPPSLRPAVVSALVDGHVSARTLAATLFDLAERDYLDIGREGQSYIFTKRRRLLSQADSKDLTSFEAALLAKLFPAGEAQSNKDDVRVRIGSTLFSRKVAEVYLGIYDAVTEAGYFYENPSTIHGSYRMTGLALFFVSLLGFGFGVWLFNDPPTPLLFWLGMMVSSLAVIGIAPHLSGYTARGLATRRAWLAFRNYLKDTSSVSFAAEREEDFFQYLPYAIALGAEVEWSRRFLKAPFRLPDWYSSADRVVRLEDFVNDLFPIVGYLARELAAVKEPTLS